MSSLVVPGTMLAYVADESDLKAAVVEAWKQDMGSLWMMACPDEAWQAFVTGAQGMGWFTVPPYDAVQARHNGRSVAVFSPMARSAWGLDEATPDALRDAVAQVNAALAPVGIGRPALTCQGLGRQVLLATSKLSPAAWEAPHGDEELARVAWADCRWHGPAPADAVVITLDRRGAFPAVASNTPFGTGELVVTDTYQQGEHGWYRVTADAQDSPWNGTTLPAPFRLQGATYAGLAMGEDIAAALEMGWAVTVSEGWYYPEDHGFLRTTITKLWAARQAVTSPFAAGVVKRSMNSLLGYVAHRRPAVWGRIVAESRRRTLMGARMLLEKYPEARLCSVDVDEIQLAFPAGTDASVISPVLRSGLGGWRLVTA